MKEIYCHCCGRNLPKGGLKFIVEVKSFADFDGFLEDYPGEVEDGINELLDAMENIDSSSMEEDVYQELIYILCKNCRDKFIRNPFEHNDITQESVEAKGTIH
jgi:hypothetical protein